jgi:hypothetical protein
MTAGEGADAADLPEAVKITERKMKGKSKRKKQSNGSSGQPRSFPESLSRFSSAHTAIGR